MRTFLVLLSGTASTAAWTDKNSPAPRASTVRERWPEGLTHLWWRFVELLDGMAAAAEHKNKVMMEKK